MFTTGRKVNFIKDTARNDETMEPCTNLLYGLWVHNHLCKHYTFKFVTHKTKYIP